MKTFLGCFLLASAATLQAQVEIDQPIILTGGSGNRSIQQLEAPVNGADAVNKDYVDAAVAGTGGSGIPTMITDQSAATMNFGDAIRYCRNLVQGGFSDWRLPTFTEAIVMASTGGNTVPNDTSTGFFWLADRAMASGTSSAWSYIQKFQFASGSLSISTGTEFNYTRCVR